MSKQKILETDNLMRNNSFEEAFATYDELVKSRNRYIDTPILRGQAHDYYCLQEYKYTINIYSQLIECNVSIMSDSKNLVNAVYFYLRQNNPVKFETHQKNSIQRACDFVLSDKYIDSYEEHKAQIVLKK